MIKRVLICAVALLFVAGVGLAQEKSGQSSKAKASKSSSSWSGWITDSKCGAKGANSKHAECAQKCVREEGAKYVLYNTKDQKLYNLDDQDQAAQHVAHHVRISGQLDGDTIHVKSISMIGEKKSAESSKPGQ